MATEIINRIFFDPLHKKHFEKFMTGSNFDFEKIIPLPKYVNIIKTENIDMKIFKKIREEFENFTIVINKTPSTENIELIIKNFLVFVKRENSSYEYTKNNIFFYNGTDLDELIEKTENRSNETVLFLLSEYFRALYGNYTVALFPDIRGIRFQEWGSGRNALYTQVKEDEISFSTPWETPRKIWERMPKIIPDIPFRIYYCHEFNDNERGFIKYIPDFKTSHNYAEVKYSEHDIEIIGSIFSKKEFEVPAKYNAKIFPAGKGSIIVFSDWSDFYSKAFLLSEEEIKGKESFWNSF